MNLFKQYIKLLQKEKELKDKQEAKREEIIKYMIENKIKVHTEDNKKFFVINKRSKDFNFKNHKHLIIRK